MKFNIFWGMLAVMTGFCLTISSCQSDPCSFNIDKHEILTGIDIPTTIGGTCIPKEAEGFKISVWELDTLALQEKSDYGSLQKYMDYFRFKKLEGKMNLDKAAMLPEPYQGSLMNGDLYYRTGERNNQKWIMILNKTTGVLFGEIIEVEGS